MSEDFFREKIGFTLIELFLVILLISLVILIVSPRFRPTFTTLGLLNFSKKISSLMCFAQSRAISDGADIYFLKKEDSLILTKVLPQNIHQERTILDLEERFILHIPESIEVVFSGVKEFIFRSDGSIDFLERKESEQPKVVVWYKNKVFPKFQIVPQGTIGRITVEEIYE